MPTENPRVTFMIAKEQLDRVEAFQHERKIKSTSKAIVQLLNAGMDELEKEASAKHPLVKRPRTVKIRYMPVMTLFHGSASRE